MRVLALDHGTKRIGVAISDELGIIAQPLEFIPAEPIDAFHVRLVTILADKKVDEIVVGMPFNMDGSTGPSAQRVERFVEQLKTKVTQPVYTCDERLTTYEAENLLISAGARRKKRKQVIDKMAAAVLLQSYLDGKNS
jgi:putative Holliday junction resolvase